MLPNSFLITYSHGQELFYKFVSNFTNKLVKQLLSMTVFQPQCKRKASMYELLVMSFKNKEKVLNRVE